MRPRGSVLAIDKHHARHNLLIDGVPRPKALLFVVEKDGLTDMPAGFWSKGIPPQDFTELMLVICAIEAYFDLVWVGVVRVNIVHWSEALPAVVSHSWSLLRDSNLVSARLTTTLRTQIAFIPRLEDTFEIV